MSHSHDPITTRPAAIDADLADGDGEIELEPTIQRPLASPSSPSQSFHMALATGSMPSLTTETGELLRSRLKAAAIFLAVGYGLFFVLGLVEPTSIHGVVLLYLGLQMAVCIAVIALLASPMVLSYPQLRAVEYGFFGLMVLTLVLKQYMGGTELINRGDADATRRAREERRDQFSGPDDPLRRVHPQRPQEDGQHGADDGHGTPGGHCGALGKRSRVVDDV